MDFIIFNARILTSEGTINSGSIFIKDGKIARIGKELRKKIPGSRTIDAAGHFASPGFIDLQIYGDPKRVSAAEVRYGTTGFLTAIPCADRETTPQMIAGAVNTIEKPPDGARVLGINLEGPYLNKEKSGAQPKRFIREPDLNEVKRFFKISGRHLKMMTLAPELKGASRLIKSLRRNGVIASIGHTVATYDETERAIEAGANCATHVFNAMSCFGSREPGAIGAVLTDDRISATVILDKAHIGIPAFKVLARCKSAGKIALITDSLRYDASFKAGWDGKVYRLKDGTIAGSGLTMIKAVENTVKFGGLSGYEAISLASKNPAGLLGLSNKGQIKEGCDADIVLFDKDYKVSLTMVEGKVVYERRCAA
ncbi:MAG: N-acetylglucosamine-6-phosphate deacetylase [Candidatus Omnitrophota bacterium]